MGGNDFGDDGIRIIAGALGKTRISTLSVWKSGITDTGAKELSTGLSLNQSIKEFRVYDNPITVEGTLLVLKSAVENGVCEKVVINDECKKHDEVQRMINTLESRQKVYYGH